MTDTEHAYALESYAGGYVSTIKDETDTEEHRYSSCKGGGLRKDVTGFYRQSRKRLLESLGKLDREAYRGSGGKTFEVTLTYPLSYPDAETSKKHLQTFRSRLERKFGEFSAYWRLGKQERGAPHFRLLLFLPYGTNTKIIRGYISRVWYEVVGSDDPNHPQAGTRGRRLPRWGRVLSYASRYLAKKEDLGNENIGRVWGVWRRGLLPVKKVRVHMTETDFFRIRRWYRRKAGLRGFWSINAMTIFVPHTDVERMAQWLGYTLS